MTLEIDPGKTALVLIDLQKGILANALAPYDRDAVVEKGLALAEAVKAAGGFVVAVNVDLGADRSLAPGGVVDAPMSGEPPADFAEIIPELMALKDIVVTKHQWGAMHGTGLDTRLKRRGIDTIILCGVATNLGVESTAREAWSHNYSVIVAEDACSTFAAEMHAFAMSVIFPRIARVRSTAEVIAALSGR